MVNRSKIIIISATCDIHSRAVAQRLVREAEVEVYIFNIQYFPGEFTISVDPFGNGKIKTRLLTSDDAAIRITLNEYHAVGETEITFDEIRCIWVRKPYFSSPNLSSKDRQSLEMTHIDSRALIEGFFFLAQSQEVPVFPDPRNSRVYRNKPYQLVLAQRIGLKVPETLITNDANEARQFLTKSSEPSIAKTLDAMSGMTMIKTKLVDGELISNLTKLDNGPVIFQRFIEGEDLRVTVAGQEIYAARIRTKHPEAHVDWRTDRSPIIEECSIDDETCKGIFELMDQIGLNYGAFDFKSTAEGLVFLEVNPGGQFLFVEVQTGQPISLAVARMLLGESDHAGIASVQGLESYNEPTASPL